MEQQNIRPLTGLRALAALAVFADHWQLLPQGAMGVSLFFCLSGFVLAYHYGPGFAHRRPGALGAYAAARVARIWPMHWLGLLLVLAFAGGWLHRAQTGHLGRLALNALLLQAFSPHARVVFSFNGVAWSMSDELFFYALFPLVAAMLLSRLSARGLGWFVGAQLALAVALPLVVTHLGMGPGRTLYYTYVFPPVRLPEFLAGAGLGMIWRTGAPLVRMRVRDLRSLSGIGLVILTALAVRAAFPGQDVRLYTLLYLPAFSWLLVNLAAPGSGFIHRLLGSRVMVHAGQASFSFYVLHQIVRRYYALVHPGVPALAGVFLTSALLAWFTLHRVETPLRNWLRGRLTGPVRSERRRAASLAHSGAGRSLAR